MEYLFLLFFSGEENVLVLAGEDINEVKNSKDVKDTKDYTFFQVRFGWH